MTEKWREDLGQSAEQFVNVVWPDISERWFDDGDIAPVEAVSEEDFADRLDQLAGIDYWVVRSESGMRGIASRVQTYHDLSTFTVRHQRDSGVDTEYQKRKEAIKNDFLYPYWTIQAYVWHGELENVAVARTDELIRYINRGELGTHYGEKHTDENGAAKFYHVHWKDLDKYYNVNWIRRTNDSLRFDPRDKPKENQSTLIDF